MAVEIETLITEGFQAAEQAKTSVTREICFPDVQGVIKVAIGMRRSGKTFLLYQTVNALLDQGIPKEQILIINFEDERLLPMTAKEMGALLDRFYTLYPKNHSRRCYFFLDEVQNIPGWHLVVRRYFDTKDVQLYLTGSSAKLLSKEINTSLRGRSLAREILPFSFQEFLCAHDHQIKASPFGQAEFDQAKKLLIEYFHTGGFPAVQSLPRQIWRETIQGYIDTVILRDIVERHSVTNTGLLKYLINSLIKNAAAPFSINKFYNDVTSQGYKTTKGTLHTYLIYIEDAFLVCVVPHYSESLRASSTKPKKIYAIDPGLIDFFNLEGESLGNQFENLVYLNLRRENKTIYYYTTQSGYEIDFITIDPEGKKEILQVAWEIDDPKTLERELRALKEAEQELKLTGRLITAHTYLKEVWKHQ